MSYRSTPSLAVGGVAWIDAWGEPGDALNAPVGGWRCFHCNEHFTSPHRAKRHFGMPGSNKTPKCLAVPPADR